MLHAYAADPPDVSYHVPGTKNEREEPARYELSQQRRVWTFCSYVAT